MVDVSSASEPHPAAKALYFTVKDLDAIFERAIALNPDAFLAHYHLGRLLLASGTELKQAASDAVGFGVPIGLVMQEPPANLLDRTAEPHDGVGVTVPL